MNNRFIKNTANTDNIVKLTNNEKSDYRWDKAHPQLLYCVHGIWPYSNDCMKLNFEYFLQWEAIE